MVIRHPASSHFQEVAIRIRRHLYEFCEVLSAEQSHQGSLPGSGQVSRYRLWCGDLSDGYWVVRLVLRVGYSGKGVVPSTGYPILCECHTWDATPMKPCTFLTRQCDIILPISHCWWLTEILCWKAFQKTSMYNCLLVHRQLFFC